MGDQSIDRELRGSALTHSQFIQLGSVSPDYPYLDILQPGQKCWADHMHYERTGDAIKAMAGKLADLGISGFQKGEFIIPYCWTLGYISHVTGDLVVHPVVFNIVGPYVGNEIEHRHCEMIQDAFIYHKIRRGAEIKHNKLMEIIQTCSDPANKEEIQPVLDTFWKDVLNTLFPRDFQDIPPDIDQWHSEFEAWIGFAGRPRFVGRIFDPNHKFTYKTSSGITPEEKKSFLNKISLSNGRIGTYEKDVFPKAVKQVLNEWTLLSKGILKRNLDDFLATISNCDLDTGKDLQTLKLVYW